MERTWLAIYNITIKRQVGESCPLSKVNSKGKLRCRDITEEQLELLFLDLHKISYEQQGTYLMNRVDILPGYGERTELTVTQVEVKDRLIWYILFHPVRD